MPSIACIDAPFCITFTCTRKSSNVIVPDLSRSSMPFASSSERPAFPRPICSITLPPTALLALFATSPTALPTFSRALSTPAAFATSPATLLAFFTASPRASSCRVGGAQRAARMAGGCSDGVYARSSAVVAAAIIF